MIIDYIKQYIKELFIRRVYIPDCIGTGITFSPVGMAENCCNDCRVYVNCSNIDRQFRSGFRGK